jgi:ketosteroid isomerase-like protein
VSERFPGENLEIATQMFIWWNLADREIVTSVVDPEIELHTPLTSTTGGPYRGIEGLVHWIGEIDDQFDEWYSLPDEWRQLDDGRVLVLGELHMRGRESGIELDQSVGWLLTFREGRLRRYEVFADHEEALAAAGVPK